MVQFVNLSPKIINRNGDIQKTMEGVSRFAGVSFRESHRKLAGSVRGIRRTRVQPARFQRRACGLRRCNQSSIENAMRLTLPKKKNGFHDHSFSAGTPCSDGVRDILRPTSSTSVLISPGYQINLFLLPVSFSWVRSPRALAYLPLRKQASAPTKIRTDTNIHGSSIH